MQIAPDSENKLHEYNIVPLKDKRGGTVPKNVFTTKNLCFTFFFIINKSALYLSRSDIGSSPNQPGFYPLQLSLTTIARQEVKNF